MRGWPTCEVLQILHGEICLRATAPQSLEPVVQSLCMMVRRAAPLRTDHTRRSEITRGAHEARTTVVSEVVRRSPHLLVVRGVVLVHIEGVEGVGKDEATKASEDTGGGEGASEGGPAAPLGAPHRMSSGLQHKNAFPRRKAERTPTSC